GSDVNAARLLLWEIDEPAWQAELPRLVTGFIARQQGGAWSTTTANLWGGLALRRFSAKFESTPDAGRTEAQLHGETGRVDWTKVVRVQPGDAAGAPHWASQWGAPSAPGMLTGNKLLLAWPQGGA